MLTYLLSQWLANTARLGQNQTGAACILLKAAMACMIELERSVKAWLS